MTSASDAMAPSAAVLAGLSRCAPHSDQILLTMRAGHLNAHAGEVAFPGGKREPQDSSLEDTALRESCEEVGLCPSRVTITHRLPTAETGRGTRVVPFVGRLDHPDNLEANPDELDALFWVPVAFFMEDPRVATDVFQRGSAEFWAPVYHWQGYKIWGFTARVILQVLGEVYGVSFGRQHRRAPEHIFRSKVD